MRQSIRGYADGLIELSRHGGDNAGDAVAVASELAGVRSVLDGSEDLRRVLSDPGVPVASRRTILVELFGSRVGAATMRALSFVLDADRAGETAGDIGWLAERLEAAGRGMTPVGDNVLGHSAAAERIDGYATAVLETLERDRALGEVEDELFRFQRVVAGADELRQALTDRDLPVDARGSIVTDLLAGKASAATTSLAAYVTRVGRPRDYEDLLEGLVARVAAESNRRVAEVRSAVDLDEGQRQQLAAALGRAVGHEVEVRVTVDPSVIAGFVATIGDTVVDATARHRLDLLKERLVMPEVNITTGERH